jgi:hypothetical protein
LVLLPLCQTRLGSSHSEPDEPVDDASLCVSAPLLPSLSGLVEAPLVAAVVLLEFVVAALVPVEGSLVPSVPAVEDIVDAAVVAPSSSDDAHARSNASPRT